MNLEIQQKSREGYSTVSHDKPALIWCAALNEPVQLLFIRQTQTNCPTSDSEVLSRRNQPVSFGTAHTSDLPSRLNKPLLQPSAGSICCPQLPLICGGGSEKLLPNAFFYAARLLKKYPDSLRGNQIVCVAFRSIASCASSERWETLWNRDQARTMQRSELQALIRSHILCY